MGFLGSVLAALLATVLADELRAAQPWLMERVLRVAVCIAPAKYRDRLHEEWRAHLDDAPGDYTRILMALGFLIAASKLAYKNQVLGTGRRGLDIAVSAAVLSITAPVIAAIALALRSGVGTPVLFYQVRGGRRGQPFVMIKFRTMAENYDAAGRLVPDAERTPWIGHLLRRTRLDELPQLWNVLTGSMSIVGPRPLVAAELALLPDGGAERSSVRPGITGWAQVHGGQLLDLQAKAALDVWYVRHASFALDIKILILTLWMVVRGDRPGGRCS